LSIMTLVSQQGLIRLPRPALLNAGVQLVCLPLSPPALAQAQPGTTATIVGWGHTNLRDQADGVLESSSLVDRIAEYNQQKARVKIISLEECQEQWGNSLAPLLSTQVCTDSSLGATTCKGDSGRNLH